MMKHFKKLTLVAALLLLLTATGSTSSLLPLPSITVGEEEAEPTPQLEEPGIQPFVDEDDEEHIDKTF